MMNDGGELEEDEQREEFAQLEEQQSRNEWVDFSAQNEERSMKAQKK